MWLVEKLLVDDLCIVHRLIFIYFFNFLIIAPIFRTRVHYSGRKAPSLKMLVVCFLSSSSSSWGRASDWLAPPDYLA